jgi:hydroxymethylbilane synthase
MLPSEVFVPAGGQGVIAMQIRSDDEQLREMVTATNHFDTRLCLRAEREFLRLLHADCNQPVGVVAKLDGPIMKIRGQIFDLGATTPRQGLVEGNSEDAEKLAAQLLEQIRG